jgi:hypothetical protein
MIALEVQALHRNRKRRFSRVCSSTLVAPVTTNDTLAGYEYLWISMVSTLGLYFGVDDWSPWQRTVEFSGRFGNKHVDTHSNICKPKDLFSFAVTLCIVHTNLNMTRRTASVIKIELNEQSRCEAQKSSEESSKTLAGVYLHLCFTHLGTI